MKAVHYEKPFEVSVREVPQPKIEHPDDVIVKVTTAGILGDLLEKVKRMHSLRYISHLRLRPTYVPRADSGREWSYLRYQSLSFSLSRQTSLCGYAWVSASCARGAD